jgi:hypothetical protein
MEPNPYESPQCIDYEGVRDRWFGEPVWSCLLGFIVFAGWPACGTALFVAMAWDAFKSRDIQLAWLAIGVWSIGLVTWLLYYVLIGKTIAASIALWSAGC